MLRLKRIEDGENGWQGCGWLLERLLLRQWAKPEVLIAVQNNLNMNGIHVRDSRTRLPNHISSHVEVLRAERDFSPGLSSEQIDGYLDRLDTLASGCKEAHVEEFLNDSVFPKDYDATYGRRTGLERPSHP